MPQFDKVLRIDFHLIFHLIWPYKMLRELRRQGRSVVLCFGRGYGSRVAICREATACIGRQKNAENDLNLDNADSCV